MNLYQCCFKTFRGSFPCVLVSNFRGESLGLKPRTFQTVSKGFVLSRQTIITMPHKMANSYLIKLWPLLTKYDVIWPLGMLTRLITNSTMYKTWWRHFRKTKFTCFNFNLAILWGTFGHFWNNYLWENIFISFMSWLYSLIICPSTPCEKTFKSITVKKRRTYRNGHFVRHVFLEGNFETIFSPKNFGFEIKSSPGKENICADLTFCERKT